MERTVGYLLAILPLIFAFGFLVPVIMAFCEVLAFTPPFGWSTFTFAAALAGTWGLYAQIKGSWV